MKFKKTLFGLFFPLLSAQQLFASVSVQFEFEALRDASGNPLISDTYAVFIADTNKDSVFPSATNLFENGLEVGDYVGNDRIFYSGIIQDGILDGGTGALTGNDLGLASNDEISGTRWAVYWFPGLSAAPGAGGLQAGQSYGYYHNDEIDPYTQTTFGATAAMVLPSDGSTVQVLYLDTATEATAFPSTQDFTASFIVIPEPTALILALFSSAFLLCRRRI